MHTISHPLLTLLGPFIRIWLRWASRRRMPQTDGIVKLKGLISNVVIIRDKWGVPHIYANDIHDLLFAQGFIHAQDRLWQMDFQRRVASGRLSEILEKK